MDQELIQCSGCKKRFFADGFRTTRLGRRLKTCLECNARDKVKRDHQQCLHGKQKWDCKACSPDKFCEHGKCKARHTCSVCDAVRNTRRMRIRNSREFATQPGGWPYEHVRLGSQSMYDTVVNGWKKTFATALQDGDIDEDYHAKILANLKPWDAEGHAKRTKEFELNDERGYRSCEHSFCSFGCSR